MTYEWDNSKNQFNLMKHGIDFEDIERFDWDNAVSITSDRHGESRTSAIGYIGSTLHFVVYTIRGDRYRIISLRAASRKEREFYGRAH